MTLFRPPPQYNHPYLAPIQSTVLMYEPGAQGQQTQSKKQADGDRGGARALRKHHATIYIKTLYTCCRYKNNAQTDPDARQGHNQVNTTLAVLSERAKWPHRHCPSTTTKVTQTRLGGPNNTQQQGLVPPSSVLESKYSSLFRVGLRPQLCSAPVGC